MAESFQHQELVALILEFVYKTLPLEEHGFVCIDDGRRGVSLPPQTLEGHRADVFFTSSSSMIIGEAKTALDIERPHSINQYRSYLKKCSLFQGESLICIAVPWTEAALVHNILVRLKKEYIFNGICKIVIIDNLRGYVK